MLLQIMEDFLKEAPKTADYDSVRQSVVILMGKLAKDMDKDSTKVKNILGQLISTLNTPSQQVNQTDATKFLLTLVLFRFKLLWLIVFHH
jgi:hypothetical protein